MKAWFWLAPLFLATLFNFNVLENGFGWDDTHIIPTLKQGESLGDIFSSLKKPGSGIKGTAAYYRPLTSLSYRLDHFLWGKEPIGFHMSVLLFHLLNTLLVYILCLKLFEYSAGLKFYPALLASCLFAVHPIHAEAVAWISGRSDVLLTFFLLISLISYIHFREKGSFLYGGISLVFFLLALMTKEAGILFFLLFPVYDFVSSSGPFSRRLKRSLPGLAVFSIPSVFLFFIRLKSMEAAGLTGFGAADGSANQGAGLLETLNLAGFYFQIMLFPFPHRPFIGSAPAGSFVFALTSALFILMAIGGYWSLRKTSRVPAFSIAWLVLSFPPVLAVAYFNLAAAPAAERYLYLPSIGFFLLLGWSALHAGTFIKNRLGGRGAVAGRWVFRGSLLLVFFLLLSLGRESFARNKVWKDSTVFWETALTSAPESSFPRKELAWHYSKTRREREAVKLYREAYEIEKKQKGPNDPSLAEILNNLGVIYQSNGIVGEALATHELALKIQKTSLPPGHEDFAGTLNNLGIDLDLIGDYDRAEGRYREALSIWEKTKGPESPEVARVYFNLAVPLLNQNRLNEAEESYKKAIRIWTARLGEKNLYIVEGYGGLGGLYEHRKEFNKAAYAYERRLAIKKEIMGAGSLGLVSDYRDYIRVLKELNRNSEAREFEEEIRRIKRLYGL